MRELPRHKATDRRVMSDENTVPGHEAEAAAQTSEKRRSQRNERSSHTPMAVTASGTNFDAVKPVLDEKRLWYLATFLSNARTAARAGEPAERDAERCAAVNGLTTVTST